jgi:hypothetical protein
VWKYSSPHSGIRRCRRSKVEAPHRAGFLLSRSRVSASSRYRSAIRPNRSRSALKGDSLAMFSALRWSWRRSETREVRVILIPNLETAVGLRARSKS